MERVERLRLAYGSPLAVTSAMRCRQHNAAVSETGDDGPHTTGRAIDFLVDRGDAYDLLRLALQMGFTGIGVQQRGDRRFLHLDDLPDAPRQPRPTVWSYP
jgi:uncharacterized protein YcbK (DUF882 family)